MGKLIVNHVSFYTFFNHLCPSSTNRLSKGDCLLEMVYWSDMYVGVPRQRCSGEIKDLTRYRSIGESDELLVVQVYDAGIIGA